MGTSTHRKKKKIVFFKSQVKMENTQGVSILYASVLILNFLIAEKQRTAAKRPGIEREFVEINKPRYFKNILNFKKSKNVFFRWKSPTL